MARIQIQIWIEIQIDWAVLFILSYDRPKSTPRQKSYMFFWGIYFLIENRFEAKRKNKRIVILKFLDIEKLILPQGPLIRMIKRQLEHLHLDEGTYWNKRLRKRAWGDERARGNAPETDLTVGDTTVSPPHEAIWGI